MEPPIAFEADALRDEKVRVLRAIDPDWNEARIRQDVVRGQYTAGWLADHKVPGYRQEPEVAPDSTVETFVALRLEIQNWRWADVPFYLRVGKRLPRRATEVAVQFKQPPLMLFRESMTQPEPNLLAMRIQPDEGILLRFAAKVPGLGPDVRSVNMDFTYGSSFLTDAPEAYETLILDSMLGDASLFTRADEVEAAWSLVAPARRDLGALGRGGGEPHQGRAEARPRGAGPDPDIRRRHLGPGRRGPAHRARRPALASAMSPVDGAHRGHQRTRWRHALAGAHDLHRRDGPAAVPHLGWRGAGARSPSPEAEPQRVPASRRPADRAPHERLDQHPHPDPHVGPDAHRRRVRGGGPGAGHRCRDGARRPAPVACGDPDACRPRRPGRRSRPTSTRPASVPQRGTSEICTEEIVLRVGGELAQHLSSTVAPLIIHDLPAVLWWPDDAPFGVRGVRGAGERVRPGPGRRRWLPGRRHRRGLPRWPSPSARAR